MHIFYGGASRHGTIFLKFPGGMLLKKESFCEGQAKKRRLW
jgi:hypothetical protein